MSGAPLIQSFSPLISFFSDRILSTARAIDRSLRETKGDAFVERLYASLPRIPRKAKPKASTAGASSSQVDGFTGEVEENRAPTLSSNASEADAIKAYEDWATNVRFEYCDLSIQPSAAVLEARQRRIDEGQAPTVDDSPSYMSAYNQEARMLTNSDIPKRNLAIAKEV